MTWKNEPIAFQKAVSILTNKRLINPPCTGGIIFIGSSIFRLWKTLESDMSPLPVCNQAFGGSRTWEVLHYADQLIIPHQPKIIVYYCGSNDISAGKNAIGIRERFQKFVEYIAIHLPQAHIFFVSINRAPAKRLKWFVVDAANDLIQQYCSYTRNVDFIDVNPALFVDDQPLLELYLDDQVHFKSSVYIKFTKIIKPILENAWRLCLK